MRYLELVNELRRNPKINVKKSPNEILKNYWKNSTERVGYPVTVKDLFVSFTELKKLGINPQSKYNTPLGIYAYTVSTVIQLAGDERPMNKSVPFAGDHPYINLFKFIGDGYVLVINRMREDNTTMYFYEQLRKIMSVFEKSEMRGGYLHTEDLVDQFVKEAEEENRALVNSTGGHFWYVTWRCSEILSNRKKIARPVAWNWLFRKLGIDAVVDTGAGIIHENEPEQAVFFNTADIELIERIDNKYSPAAINTRIEQGVLTKQKQEEKKLEIQTLLKTGNFEKIITWLDEGSNKEYVRFLPKNLRLQVLQKRPYYIYYLKSPTRKEQITALTAEPFMLIHDTGGQKKFNLPLSDIIQAINNHADISKYPASYWELKRLNYYLNSDDPKLLMALLRLNVGIISEIKHHLNLTPELIQYIKQLANKQGFSDIHLGDLTNSSQQTS